MSGRSVPDPPRPDQLIRPRPVQAEALSATGPAARKGAPAWAVLLISLQATALVCMLATVAVLALFGEQIAKTVRGTAETVSAGAAPMAVATSFYSMLDSGYYGFAHEMLGPEMAEEYSTERLREEWQALEKAEVRVLPLPTNVKLEGDRAIVTVLLSSSITNRIFGVDLTLEYAGDETWYIVGAEPSLIPDPKK